MLNGCFITILYLHWIWDQSLMTVEINTITRVTRQDICMSCNYRRHDHPRSIVTDQRLESTLPKSLINY